MARLRPPRVTEKLIPVFTSGELSKLEKVCAGRACAQRRDLAIIAVFRATGVRLSELAGIAYDAEDAQRSDVDLWQREITVRGKGRKGADRQDQPPDRRQPWPLYPGPGTACPGVPAAAVAGSEQPGPDDGERHLSDDCAPRPPVRGGRVSAPVPSSFQPHLAGPGRRRGGPDGAERVDLAADAAPLRRQRPQHTSTPQLRPHHGPHPLTRQRLRLNSCSEARSVAARRPAGTALHSHLPATSTPSRSRYRWSTLHR